jgi:hypothetical protein
MRNGKLTGVRTDAWTGEERQVEVEYEIVSHDSKYAKPGELAFQVTKGGVTGFESFLFVPNDGTLEEMSKTGWCACAGTPKSWDKLFIPPEEMKKVTLD